MSAQDAARAVLSLALSAPALCRECARFVLAVDPANEALVETVARALAAPYEHENMWRGYRTDARRAVAAIAQAAGGHDGCLPCAEGSTPADHRLGDS